MKTPKRTSRKTGAKAPAANALTEEEAAAREEEEAGRSGVEQAVVIIHGMGEQRPMEIVRSFVHAVWSTHLELTNPWKSKRTVDPDTGKPINKSWIVPDRRTGSHELRRITTPRSITTGWHGGLRTDFYEIYWADLIRETPPKRLLNWLWGRLTTPWAEIPKDAVGLYVMAWAALLFGIAPAVATWLLDAFGFEVPLWLSLLLTVWAFVVSIAMTRFLVPYLGDVADYVSANPDTVGRRAAVRERAFGLLKTLNDESHYDRIVVVGHSLGSIVAYDVLQILWADCGPSLRNPRSDRGIVRLLKQIGEYAQPLGKNGKDGKPIRNEAELAEFRNLQWALYKRLRTVPSGKNEKPWKFSDFISVGSPLTHAEFLIARNQLALDRAIEERLFVKCPPISDSETESTIIYKKQHAHHAAMFAAMRWTNIYDLGNKWVTGDPFSGKAADNFGPGIKDVRVRLTSEWMGIRSRLFTHTCYWDDPDRDETTPPHIVVLRHAVDLNREMDSPN